MSRIYFNIWRTVHRCGPHPPYSPDLTTCELSLFLRMKSLLRGHCFQVVPKIKQWSLTILQTIPKSQLQQCLQQWQKCLSHCINSERDHLKADNKDQQQRCVYIALSTQSGNFWIRPLIKTLNKNMQYRREDNIAETCTRKCFFL
jgi:hypothetical protein